MAYKEKFEKTLFRVPDLVIPNKYLDLSKYATLAGNKKDAEYWNETFEYIGKEPSTLYFTMPDAWQGEEHQTHEDLLCANMKFFLVNGSLEELDAGTIIVRRTLKNGKVRTGLLMAFDLENLENVKNIKPVDEDKLKRSVAVRAKLPLECPYVLMGYEDSENVLNSLLTKLCEEKKAIYDFDLMNNSGHLNGTFIKDENELDKLADALSQLTNNEGALSIIDGNDVLAIAKANWDKFKKYIPAAQREDHPARFTLVELINADDETLPLSCDEDARFSFDSRRITKINKEHIVPNSSWSL